MHNSTMKYALAFDVGGTKILGCLVSEKGKILGKLTEKTPQKPVDFIGTVSRMAFELGRGRKVEGIGIGMPCFLNESRTSTIFCSNIPRLNCLNLCSLLSKKTRMNVQMGNDADLFALGEWAFRFKRKPSNFIGIIAGTG